MRNPRCRLLTGEGIFQYIHWTFLIKTAILDISRISIYSKYSKILSCIKTASYLNSLLKSQPLKQAESMEKNFLPHNRKDDADDEKCMGNRRN